MEAKAMFSLLLLAVGTLAVAVSGVPTPANVQCSEPLWTVVGNHYAPRETCNHRDVSQSTLLREKYFKIFLEKIKFPDFALINKILDDLMELVTGVAKTIEETVLCSACEAVVETYRLLKRESLSTNEILALINSMCVDLNVMTPLICNKTLETYGRTLTTIMDHPDVTAKYMCSNVLNARCGDTDTPEKQWHVTLPPTKKPKVTAPSPLPDTVKKMKVLHMTDIHWDPHYAEGSWSECREPLCCRKENVLPNNAIGRAGKYGGWKCDIPEITLDEMLAHIAERHPDIDYILWTGDLPPHDIWDQGRPDSLQSLKKTASKIYAAFPNTPVYPALGNHESVPPNMFPLPRKSHSENPMDWLYDELNAQWSTWLPQNIQDTVRLGAFYTTLIRPGLRLVSMNTNYCYIFNWWLVLDNVDPLNELQWFVNVLQEAENNNETVHVIGHVPPGSSDCLKAWQTNYYRIINRYESTVTAQFFGHLHNDAFEIYYDEQDKSRPVGVGYIAPSVTTYTYLNPSYRIYYVEGDAPGSKRYVTDHETWYLDLKKANTKKEAEWQRLYSPKIAYNLNTLYPKDWHGLYEKLKNSKEFFNHFHNLYWVNSPKRPECNEECRRSLLCEIRSCVQYGHPK